MACHYKRPNSPFWWIRHRVNGVWKSFSSGLRIGSGANLRAIREKVAQLTLEESQTRPKDHRHDFALWVTPYLNGRYHHQPSTLERYLDCWKTISLFLSERGVTSPSGLQRSHCFEYLDWRAEPDAKRGKYSACRNTAILELKILGLLMDEAVHRRYCQSNPCCRLKVKRDRPKQKPEFSEADLNTIHRHILQMPESDLRTALERSFLIARYQGCRLSETQVNPITDVVFYPDGATITFRRKGGRIDTTTLHPALHPLFRQLQQSGTTLTYPAMPATNHSKRSTRLQKAWNSFFKRTGLKSKIPGATFHSLRVTAITRMARHGVPIQEAMHFVGHASETMNRIYVRLGRLDSQRAIAAQVTPSADKPDAQKTPGAALDNPTTPTP